MLVAAGMLVVTWVWVAFAGRDLSWDIVNHHYYLPFSLLTGRFRDDLFAAGPQAYQNPIGYVPFYLLARSALPSWGVGAILAALHALAAWPLHRIAVQVWGDKAADWPWRVGAIALAWTAPAFLIVAGSSSVDVLASPLMLAALAIVLGSSAGWRAPALAGAAVGLAFAIKPSNATFVIAIGAVLLLRCSLGTNRWRDLGVYCAATLAAIAVAMGPWSLWLWQRFGNPVFPLFNNIFHSPYAPQQAIVATRFMPHGALDYLLRPAKMALYESFGTMEEFAPDIRPVVAVALGVPALLWAFVRHRQTLAACLRRTDAQLVVFSVVAYYFWMKSSGNARYAIPLLMVVGLLVVRAASSLFAPTPARIVVLLVLALQTMYFVGDGRHRLGASDWTSGPYLEVHVPPRLVEQPFLHLSLGTLSLAGLAPYMHPDGAMINLVGQMSMPTEGPLADELKQRLDRWQGRVRFLFLGVTEDGKAAVPEKFVEHGNAVVYRYGLRFDLGDCEQIMLLRYARDGHGDFPVMSCAAVKAPLDRPGFEADRARADRVFGLLEAQCPAVLAPSPMISDTDLDTWQRRYVNTDARILISPKDGVQLSHFRSMQIAYLGSIDDVLAGRGRNACEAWHAEIFP